MKIFKKEENIFIDKMNIWNHFQISEKEYKEIFKEFEKSKIDSQEIFDLLALLYPNSKEDRVKAYLFMNFLLNLDNSKK